MVLHNKLRPSRPAGLPLHQLIYIGKLGDVQLGTWIRRIGRIHGGLDRPRVVAEFADLPDLDAEGAYFETKDLDPIVIRVPRGARRPQMVLCHEVGHYLDRQHLDGPKVQATKSGVFVRGLVADALSTKSQEPSVDLLDRMDAKLENYQGVPEDVLPPDILQLATDRGRLAYILSFEEVFARIYMQFAAGMMKIPEMRNEIRSFRARSTELDLIPYFWPDREFLPIAEEVQRIFVTKGLMEWT